jgi:hypothetical protein
LIPRQSVGNRCARLFPGGTPYSRSVVQCRVEDLVPVVVLEATSDQYVPPVHVRESERVAKAAEVATSPKHDGRLDALAGVHIAEAFDDDLSRTRLGEAEFFKVDEARTS